MTRRLCLALLVALIATPAAADSWKFMLRGTQHCDGTLGQLLGPRFAAPASIDMPSNESGSDGTVWIDQIHFKGASYTRSGDYFAITGWTNVSSQWFHISIHGRLRGERARGVFHFMPFGSTCFAEGKLSR